MLPFLGEIPNVTADWQWSGVWPVTTPAVMSGAWHLPVEKRLVLLFANVAEQSVTATAHYDLRNAGLIGSTFARRRWTPQGGSEATRSTSVLRETVTFPPRAVWAWEFTAQE